jgi:hypothetical protein
VVNRDVCEMNGTVASPSIQHCCLEDTSLKSTAMIFLWRSGRVMCSLMKTVYYDKYISINDSKHFVLIYIKTLK